MPNRHRVCVPPSAHPCGHPATPGMARVKSPRAGYVPSSMRPLLRLADLSWNNRSMPSSLAILPCRTRHVSGQEGLSGAINRPEGASGPHVRHVFDSTSPPPRHCRPPSWTAPPRGHAATQRTPCAASLQALAPLVILPPEQPLHGVTRPRCYPVSDTCRGPRTRVKRHSDPSSSSPSSPLNSPSMGSRGSGLSPLCASRRSRAATLLPYLPAACRLMAARTALGDV